MESSSDSSCSDENENLREALDPSMFAAAKCSTKSKLKRSAIDPQPIDSNYKNNILNVTPEFQNFVAKRLTEMLDRTIKECHKDVDFAVSKSSGGIRLFTESKKLLKDRKFVDPFYSNAESDIPIKPKKRKSNSHKPTDYDSETELLEKLRDAESAAVSPSWVLEKKGIVGWSRPKGETFNYTKNKNGELELVDHR